MRRTNVAITGNGWCYEQVCLAEMFKLPKMLLANLLIARVISWLRLIKRKTKYEALKKRIKKK